MKRKTRAFIWWLIIVVWAVFRLMELGEAVNNYYNFFIYWISVVVYITLAFIGVRKITKLT